MAFRDDKEDGTAAVEMNDLHVARILSDVRIVKTALGVGLVELFAVHDVVEDERNPKAANMNGFVCTVGQ
jgi:hypothetical protein